MPEPSLSPVDLDVVRSQNKDHLYEAITEQRNPFRGFDWGDHIICTPQNNRPGLLASSKPYWSSLPNVRYVWDTPSPQREKTWMTVVAPEISRLGKKFALPWKLMSKYHLARGEYDPGFDVIQIGIDVSRPVKKADAEAFVQQCSEMLATHDFDNTVVEVHHSRYWGNLAEQFSSG